MRKRALVLMLATWTFLLSGGAVALGQPTGPIAEDYVYSHGKVVVGGDVVVPCGMVSEFGPTDDATSETRAQFEQAGDATLPGTGGGSAVLLAPGVLLVCAGLGLIATHRTS